MKFLPTCKHAPAIVALLAASFSITLAAQTLFPGSTSPSPETAALVLPNAPEPQNSTTAPPAASSSSSSSSATPPPATSPDTPAVTKEQQRAEQQRELKVEEQQRLLGIMPQFQVVEGGKAVALTGGQKWQLASHSAIDPFYIAWAFVVGGGLGEAEDSHTGYGWGPAAYFKRVGATYADNVNGALIGNALLPQLLHQDPRYFRKGSGPVFKRFLYAAESTVICHGDNGKNQVNVSNVLGNYISGAISNAYYPANERGVGLTFENGTSVTLFGALGGQLLEFGPDIARLLHRHKAPSSAVPALAAPATPAPASH